MLKLRLRVHFERLVGLRVATALFRAPVRLPERVFEESLRDLSRFRVLGLRVWGCRVSRFRV